MSDALKKTITAPLSPELTRAALSYLGVLAASPTLDLIETIVTAYTRTVPWESAFRIAKRARTPHTADCPRWPDEFWADAMTHGGGGTCFESNYALFSLLRSLGYEGYLTINNMGEKIGCHAAIVLHIDGERWLVDGGIPLYIPLRIDPSAPTQRDSAFHTYTVRPDGEGVCQVERTKHPKPNCYTLIDTPISDDAYRAATTADYGSNGHFLDRIIICKVVNDRAWRFCSSETPLCIESFWEGERTEHLLDGHVAKTVGEHFGMDVDTVHAALTVTTSWETSQ
ncbi:MAG: arylamine N-acetyltransferase [Chloroflexi bacterium]|nr:arylamine N-acetyltransferase [Chloroflexota bacterium]